jgi:Uncharacterised nucleotidyltransferase
MIPRTIGNGLLVPNIPKEVAALMDALQLQDADTSALKALTDREWEALLSFSDLAHLTLSLFDLPGDGFPAWVADRLSQNASDNAARFERVKRTYREAAAALVNANVEFLVLKGFTQAPDYVRSGRLRMQSDLDIYCPAGATELAAKTLRSIGYVLEDTLDYAHADHLPALIRIGDWQWGGNSFDPEMPLSIELHFCLWNESQTLLPLPEERGFWNRRTVRTVEDFTFPTLNSKDQLAYFSLHILRNLLGENWILHHVRELATFLHAHAKDDAFWLGWRTDHSDSLRRLEAIAFSLAMRWFRCEVHDEVHAAIADMSSAVTTWLERFSGSSLEGMFRPNKDYVWLHAALLSSARDKRRVLKRALIPDHVPRRNSPAIGLKQRRRTRASADHTYLQFVSYLGSRVASHLSLVPPTLYKGIGWWASQRQLGKQFWTFLATSFFLTWACQSISSFSIYS